MASPDYDATGDGEAVDRSVCRKAPLSQGCA